MTVREVASAYQEAEIPIDHLPKVMETIEEHYGLDRVNDEVIRILLRRWKDEKPKNDPNTKNRDRK
jgi:hypothetical protein